MTAHTLMWEARATQGRGADLLEWTRTRAAELAEATPSPSAPNSSRPPRTAFSASPGGTPTTARTSPNSRSPRPS